MISKLITLKYRQVKLLHEKNILKKKKKNEIVKKNKYKKKKTNKSENN